FTVQCIACQPNGSNAPFEIPSTISLEELRSKVGRKMERFPDLIQLQYHLESDRAWQGAMSVQNDEEPDLFKAKMQAMIVPGHTKTGCISNCILKNPTIHFIDASMNSSNESLARSKGGGKASGSSSGATKQKPSPLSSGQLKGASRREELIKQLQERWKCDIHVKGPESLTYCYVPDEKSECCYPLTINNLSFWAIQIISFFFTLHAAYTDAMHCHDQMDDKAMVDMKPVGLLMQTARLHTQGSTVQPSSQMIGMPTQGPGMPGPQAPGYPNGYGYGPGYGPPPFFPWGGMVSSGTQQPSRLPSPTPSNMSSATHLHGVIQYIITSYLNQHTEQSQDGVNYSQFEGILQEKGFTRLSQLTSKHVTTSDLQQWLGVIVGTAINMKDYADDDLKAVKAGNLVIV
ncbi:hypothetical protein PAXRUDRAFT_788134, partial [Paxillus rubicundulus Ve08.2h10]